MNRQAHPAIRFRAEHDRTGRPRLREFHLFTALLFGAYALMVAVICHWLHGCGYASDPVLVAVAGVALVFGALLIGLQYTLHRWACVVICVLLWLFFGAIFVTPVAGQLGTAAFLLLLIFPLAPIIETDLCLDEWPRRKRERR